MIRRGALSIGNSGVTEGRSVKWAAAIFLLFLVSGTSSLPHDRAALSPVSSDGSEAPPSILSSLSKPDPTSQSDSSPINAPFITPSVRQGPPKTSKTRFQQDQAGAEQQRQQPDPEQQEPGADDQTPGLSKDPEMVALQKEALAALGGKNPFAPDDDDAVPVQPLSVEDQAAMMQARQQHRQDYPIQVPKEWAKDKEVMSVMGPTTAGEEHTSVLQLGDFMHSGSKPLAPGNPSKPMKPAAKLPVQLPPVSVMICELMCLGQKYLDCGRPCNYALACGSRTIIDQNIMLKLLPKVMLQLDIISDTADHGRFDSSNGTHWEQLAGQIDHAFRDNVTSADAPSEKELVHKINRLKTDRPNLNLEQLLRLPFSNQTRHYLESLRTDDLCANDPFMCVYRELFGEETPLSMIQTQLAATLSTTAGLAHQSGATAMAHTHTGYVFKMIATPVQMFCKMMDAWPVNIKPGFCGYMCNMGKSEDCIQLCLADHNCCSLWYCLSKQLNPITAFRSCWMDPKFCWTQYTIGCDHNADALLTPSQILSAKWSSLKNPYGYPGGDAGDWTKPSTWGAPAIDPAAPIDVNLDVEQTSHVMTPTRIITDPSQMFKFWLPPNRLNGKALGAVGLHRHGMYPYKDNNKFMSMGIGYNGHTMAAAVYGT